MAKLGRPGLPENERRRVWDLWKQDNSFSAISREVAVPPGSVYSILRPRGGIYFSTPRAGAGALSLAEREEISRGLAAGTSVRGIAAELDRPASTISREINRNTTRNTYRAVDADDKAARRRTRPQKLKLQKNPVLRNYVAARLRKCWSPEQITGRLQKDYPDNAHMQVSHEAIYRTVYLNTSRKILSHGIHRHLRRNRSIRHGKHYSTRGQWRLQIKNARPISQRPRAADDRRQAGHWEGDLILGTNTSQVATLVDRATRMVHLVQTDSRRAECVTDRLVTGLNENCRFPVTTLTRDRGMELAEYQSKASPKRPA